MDRTPLFMLNVERLRKEGYIDNEGRFLALAGAQGVELLEDLNDHESLDDTPTHLQLRLSDFLERYYAPLALTSKAARDALESDVEEITETIRDPKRLRHLINEAADDLRDGAKRLEEHSESLDLDYVHEFDFSDDPVLKRMRRNLGVLRAR